jgi:hypothetical protein
MRSMMDGSETCAHLNNELPITDRGYRPMFPVLAYLASQRATPKAAQLGRWRRKTKPFATAH